MERSSPPYGRARGSPRRSRRIEGGPVSVRSGASVIFERGMLHAVLMVNADGLNAVRADEDTFENIPLTQ
eukprot:3693068-Pyramimonas_sp.AAC.1